MKLRKALWKELKKERKQKKALQLVIKTFENELHELQLKYQHLEDEIKALDQDLNVTAVSSLRAKMRKERIKELLDVEQKDIAVERLKKTKAILDNEIPTSVSA